MRLTTLTLLAAVALAAAPADAGVLLQATEAAGPIDLTREPGIVRTRAVSVNVQQLGGLKANSYTASRDLTLDLFPGVSLQVTADRVFKNRSGSVSWVGKVVGEPASNVILISKAGVVVGSIRSSAGSFQVRSTGDGAHAVTEIDESAFPPEVPPTPVSFSEETLEAAARVPMMDDGSVFDIMVVYTSTSRTNAGGTVAMENWIDLGITETNQSYTDSGVNTQMNLVHTAEVSYNESGNLFTDRNRLQNTSDGFLDEVHAMRDLHSADMVSLIIENPGCGVAYIMNPVSTAFAPFGVNVTMRACVSPNYTFAHENGHNQAARHDRFVDPTDGAPFDFNHGYTSPDNSWRTVMAYNNDCGGCTRLLRWSNPDLNHPTTGHAMGIPAGMANAADNRMTLNSTAETVANFRVSNSIFVDGFESGNTSAWSSTVSP